MGNRKEMNYQTDYELTRSKDVKKLQKLQRNVTEAAERFYHLSDLDSTIKPDSHLIYNNVVSGEYGAALYTLGMFRERHADIASKELIDAIGALASALALKIDASLLQLV